MATEDEQKLYQILIDVFQIHSKIANQGKAWAYETTELGRAYIKVLYGIKNGEIKPEDTAQLASLCLTITKKWQEAHK